MINPDRVEELVVDALYTDEEVPNPEDIDRDRLPEGTVFADGILTTFAFHPERLESHRSEVREMLDQIPIMFRALGEGGGGGWSFLNACVVRDRANPALPFEQMEQWTGLHMRMDQLFSLGQALGFVKPVVGRDLWKAMPGGMPYYVIELGVNV